MKKIRHLISLSPKQKAKLEEIAEERGLEFIDVIYLAITDYCFPHKPEYVKVREKQIEVKNKQLELAERGVPFTKRDLSNEDSRKAMCMEMQGARIEGTSCIYPAYDCVPGKNRIVELKTPLSLMDAGYVKAQFLPSKEEYLEYCKNKNVDPYNLS